MPPSYRIGVDVGGSSSAGSKLCLIWVLINAYSIGTNTDSVILDTQSAHLPNRGVVAFKKTLTTSPNVTDGIETAVRSVLEQSHVPTNQVVCLTIGTSK